MFHYGTFYHWTLLALFLLKYADFTETSSIYRNVGDDASFNWTLDPLPSGIEAVTINNPLKITMFRVSSTGTVVEDAYKQRIAYNGDITTGQIGFTLKSITRSDAGLYTALYNVGKTYPGQTLYVYGKPNKTLIEEKSPPVVNRNLQLECSAKSTTVPSDHDLTMAYSWIVDGANITSSGGRYIVNGSRLTVQTIKLDDVNKTVKCTGTEQGGLTSDNSDVYTVDPVYGPETVTFSPTEETYSLKEHGTIPDITCNANCKPNCSYKWTKGGQDTSHGTGSTLSLRNISRNDAGVYRCTAMNEYGTKNSSDIRIDVLYGPGIVTFTPTNTTYSKIELKTIPDITCIADCKPNCSYIWTKDGLDTSHGRTLSLKNVSRNDAGVYRCRAWNNHSAINSIEINIDVLYKPTEVMFDPQTTSYTNKIGDTISNITCSALCNPTCEYSWRKGSQATSHGYGNTLQLTNLKRTDDGSYSCKAWNDYGHSISEQIDVNILFGPDPLQFNTTDLRHTINEGETLPSITCSAVCNPNCTYIWQHPDGSSTSDKTLNLGRLDRNDHGTYSCIAQNEISNRSKPLEIVVQYGPGESISLTPTKTTYTYIENKTVNESIKCHADCRPNCTYNWNTTNPTNPLIFGKVDRNKAGNYVCNATNKVSSSTTSLQLIVQFPSRVTKITSSKGTVVESDKVELKCFIDAVPLPSVQWSKDNGTTFSVSSTPSNPGLLTINSANCVDTGNYTCSVDNKITDDSRDSRNFSFTVNCAPRDNKDTDKPMKIGVATGQGLNISTYFIAFPLPNFTWSFMDEPIFQNHSTEFIKTKEYEYLSHFSKDSMSENDFGIYTVVAENVFGKANASFDVQAQRKPDPSTDVTAACFSSTKANISFLPGFNGGSPQSFSIKYTTSDKHNIEDLQLTDTRQNKTETITGLRPGAVYLFKIISSNEFGHTESDEEFRCTTLVVNELYSPVGLIGGIAGTLSGLVAITIGVVVVLFMKRRKKKSKGNSRGLRLGSGDEEDEMRDNILYEPAGPNYVKPGTSGATGGINDYTYAEVQKSNGRKMDDGKPSAVYAEVRKNPKMETSMSGDPSAIYAQVQKTKKEDKGGAKPKKAFGKQKPNTGMVYENVELEQTTNTGNTIPQSQGPSGKQDAKGEPATAKKRSGKRNKDGLWYADVVFDPQPDSGKKFVIHGLENRTNYVDIDFTKKADPLPPDDEAQDEKTTDEKE